MLDAIVPSFWGLLLVMVLLPEPAHAQAAWVPRADYHQALEPIGDRVLTNVGQDNGGQGTSPYTSFASAVGANPAVWMQYETIGDSPDAMMSHARALMSDFNQIGSDTILLQFGLDLSKGWSGKAVDRKVADGKYDDNVRGFCAVLRYLDRPAYIRIGYEFNGPGNHYRSKSYVAAFRRMAPMLRNCGVPVALVWDLSPAVESGASPNYMSYYPGDQFVDWWGINLLADASANFDFTSQTGLRFLADAESHGKPVMIGEATAVGVGAQRGNSSWEAWFQPYFNYIYSHPGIKMYTYLNDNFSNTPWPTWGDCSIPADSVVAQNFHDELQNPRYILRKPGNGVLDSINLSGPARSPFSPSVEPTQTLTPTGR
jgi:hypothetical protein